MCNLCRYAWFSHARSFYDMPGFRTPGHLLILGLSIDKNNVQLKDFKYIG